MAGLGDIGQDGYEIVGVDAGGGVFLRGPDGHEFLADPKSYQITGNRAVPMPETAPKVGIFGKALGALGLDLEGHRGRTSWSDAASTTATPDPAAGWSGMISGAIDDWNHQIEHGPDPIRSFNVAGLAATGGLAAGMAGAVPEGALASNSVGRGGAQQPIKAFHGAKSAYPETGYNPKKSQYNAFFAAEDPRYASNFARHGESPAVYPVDISPDAKMFDFSRPDHTDRLVAAYEKNPAILSNSYLVGPNTIKDWMRNGDAGILEDKGVQKWLRKSGYDGWKFEDTAGPPADNRTSYGMLRPGHVTSSVTGDLLYSNSPQSSSVPLAMQMAEQQAPKGIRAFHGSPHDFDKFDMSKIGSGEGAQASRGEGQGTRNYVLFDDSLVDITRKYANHPFGAGPALAFSDDDDQRQGFKRGGSVDLERIVTRGGVPFTVAKTHAPRFLALLNELEERGYPIAASQSGGYNDRNIAGTSKKSEHAFGRAIDVNWTDNPRGGMGKIPTELARELAQKHGFTWGGDWKNPDPMHFEIAGEPGHYHGDGHSHSHATLAQTAPSGDFFAGQGLNYSGQEFPTLEQSQPGMMALGGPGYLQKSETVDNAPFNAQSYRIAPENQAAPLPIASSNGGAEWIEGPLGLMPKWSDGGMALQGFAGGGGVMLETPLQGGNGVSGAMGSLQPGYSGPLHSEVAGRTDQIPLEVNSGAYILPADCVSALGEGNTAAGQRLLDHMFPEEAPTLQYSSGGRVPIIVAGGERALSPEQVARVGGGDLDRGHSLLDEWVKAVRAHTIQTLSTLPEPSK